MTGTTPQVPVKWLRPGTYEGRVVLVGSPEPFRYRVDADADRVTVRRRRPRPLLVYAVVFGSQIGLLALMHLVSTWQW